MIQANAFYNKKQVDGGKRKLDALRKFSQVCSCSTLPLST